MCFACVGVLPVPVPVLALAAYTLQNTKSLFQFFQLCAWSTWMWLRFAILCAKHEPLSLKMASSATIISNMWVLQVYVVKFVLCTFGFECFWVSFGALWWKRCVLCPHLAWASPLLLELVMSLGAYFNIFYFILFACLFLFLYDSMLQFKARHLRMLTSGLQFFTIL